MKQRVPIVGVLAACVVAGSLFAPVFGTSAVLWPVLAVALVAYVVEETILRRPELARWRVPLTLAGGVVALAAVVPGAASHPAGLWRGVLTGWRQTLESTWPARPDPGLVTFVPLLVLLACLLGTRLLQVSRVWALVPAIVVAGFSQAYVTVSGAGALLAGAALVGCCCLVLVRWPGDRAAWLRLVAALAAIAAGATALGLGLPDRTAAHLARPSPPDVPSVLSNPLTEVAARLRSPDQVVFTVRASAPVDRWPVIALDRFDGATWSVDPKFQRLGRELPVDPRIKVPVATRAAEVSLAGWSLPWLPSQARTVSVAEAPPLLVDPASGTLLADQTRPAHYTVTWADPLVGTGQLVSAGVDSNLLADSDLGDVPPGIDQLAREISGDLRPSFQMALVLEKYLRSHYRLAAGGDLPTGHGYAQLSHFLLQSKRGTSEQFAASYVVLARLAGLPARLVVGFRQPAEPGPDGRYVVRNGDILAWPEVAVQGVGWVPLDPTGTVAATSGGDGLADAAATVRRELPSTQELEREHQAGPQVPPEQTDGAGQTRTWRTVLLGLAGLLAVAALAWLAGVPSVKAIRRRRRRNHGTLGAWAEARDLLRDHGTRVTASATARDLAREAEGAVAQAMTQLAGCLDQALWSGRKSDPYLELAWSAVGRARDGLIQGPWSRRLRIRLRMAFSPRSLLG
ncbi:transglutaminase TgpA family protein [Flindersiella endophytica]